MSQTLISCYLHCIFSTKMRRNSITPELRDRLWPYIGGIIRENGMKALEIGGMADHIHLLISISSSITIAHAIQLVKGGSSKWVHESFPNQHNFAWQEGYAAFSIGHSSIKNVREYIIKQEEHHRKHTFKEELIAFLERYEIPYDERFLWN